MSDETSGSPVRIVIVDDHPLVRYGLAQLISDEPGLEVCGEADSAADALSLIASEKPDLAIIDLGLKSGSGMDVLRNIRSREIPVKTIVLSMHDESLFAERALKAGALGYVDKKTANGEIIDAIRFVLDGKTYLSRAMVERFQERMARGNLQPSSSTVQMLSDRELEVFQLIGEGYETRHIADRLNLSPRTIETHKERIKLKLGLTTAGELAHRAAQWVIDGYQD